MDRQAIFDKVATHLLKQNAKSRGPMGCQYRGSGGRMCAIGCLIPDDKYNDTYEGLVVPKREDIGYDDEGRLFRTLQECIGAETDEDIDFLRALQVVHDGSEPGSWAIALREFATKYGVEFHEVV
jgi:hypothetical protein